MSLPPPDDFLVLPEDLAVARHFAEINGRRARWFLGAYACAALVVAAVLATSRPDWRLWIAIADLALIGGFLLLAARRPAAGGWMLLALVALQFPVTALWSTHLALVLVFALGPFPLVLLLLRLRPAEATAFATVIVSGTMAWVLAHGDPPSRAALLGLAVAVLTASAAVLGERITRARRQRFLARWHRESARERERLRLRDEVGDARRIQLSMLPDGEPHVDWLELSGACLPAAEVGGDYYDYIRLGDDAWALVVADVAGHGVASGLLIAGLRSSLHVLQEELRRPAGVLDRLNAMVRASVRVRTFVSVAIAVIEVTPGRLRVASAGHPPALLRRAADGSVTELAAPAPPLGTRLPVRYEERVAELAAGDLVLLFTDGLVEATNPRLEAYGFSRLSRVLSRSDGRASAREVRSHVLEDVAHFKGPAVQGDDLSLVVARFLPTARA